MEEKRVRVTIKITIPKTVIPEEERDGWEQLWKTLQKDYKTLEEELLKEEKREEAARKYRWYVMDDRLWS